MKKKIVYFTNGWSNEIVADSLEGIEMCARENKADVFVFMSHASFGAEPHNNEAQNSIFSLPDLKEFDGAIISSHVLNAGAEDTEKIVKSVQEAGIPVVSIGMDLAGAGFVQMDNTIGMTELAHHIIKDCGVRRIVYVGGAKEHPDCQNRLRITQGVAEEYGLEIAEEDIYFSDWSFEVGERIADTICKSEKGIPDVVVCANDNLALAVASGMLNNGYRLPEDVKITGFDCIRDGQDFYPALTTVGTDYKEVGYQACKWIFNTIEGMNPPRVTRVQSTFVLGESTTAADPKYDNQRRKIGQRAYIANIIDTLLESRESRLEGAILQARSVESLKGTLDWFYKNAQRHEGKSFYMLLEKDYFNSVYEHRVEIDEIRVSEQKHVLLGVKDGVSVKQTATDSGELIPEYSEDDAPHIYCFAPMHVDRFVIGYLVFVDNMHFIRTRKIGVYCSRVQQALDKFRSNLYVDMINKELMEVSTTDSLTGLNNRFAYSQIVLPMFKKRKEEKERMVIIFIDINYMKIINDKFGHLQGDLALRIVADIIKKCIPKEWIALRYGGDEFMIFGNMNDSIDVEAIEKSIADGIEESRREMALPYELSVSYGYTLTDAYASKDMGEYVREADANMYAMKKRIHAMRNQAE